MKLITRRLLQSNNQTSPNKLAAKDDALFSYKLTVTSDRLLCKMYLKEGRNFFATDLIWRVKDADATNLTRSGVDLLGALQSTPSSGVHNRVLCFQLMQKYYYSSSRRSCLEENEEHGLGKK